MPSPSLTIVVPCYNESEVFTESLKELLKILDLEIKQDTISKESHLLFVDDGSTDDTWLKIKKAANDYSLVHGLKLSRNQGHQVALWAGLNHVKTDICISIDADLQDDPNVIPKMIELYCEGNEIVYGVRDDRSTDTFFKRVTAALYYKIMSKLTPDIVPQHADFRLLGNRALSALVSYPVKNLYIRGLIPQLGFKSTKVSYKRASRAAGVSHYPFFKMLYLAWEGITNQSMLLLRLTFIIGAGAVLASFMGAIYIVYSLWSHSVVPGWASLETTMLFCGAAQLIGIGLLGEYIGKIYIQAQNKPLYFIADEI